MERFLIIAYRFTSGKLAERISLRISEIRCEKRWQEEKAAHLAAGGSHVSVTVDGAAQEYLA